MSYKYFKQNVCDAIKVLEKSVLKRVKYDLNVRYD